MSLSDFKSERYKPHRSMGYSAYWDAYSADSNPFTRGTPASKAFADGWMTARKEEKEQYGKNYVPINEDDDFLRVR